MNHVPGSTLRRKIRTGVAILLILTNFPTYTFLGDRLAITADLVALGYFVVVAATLATITVFELRKWSARVDDEPYFEPKTQPIRRNGCFTSGITTSC